MTDDANEREVELTRRNVLKATGATALASGVFATGATAQGKGGGKGGGNPQINPNRTSCGGDQLCVKGNGLAGGNTYRVVFDGTASADVYCANKGNPEHVVPGQDVGPLPASGSATFTAEKNGQFTQCITITVEVPSCEEAGCPNCQNWTVRLEDLTIIGGTVYLYLVEDGSETLVDTATVSCS